MTELVGGQIFIELTVALNGLMFLKIFVVCGRPRKNYIDWIIRTKQFRTWNSRFYKDMSATDMGLDPDHLYNLHRTFSFNTNNHRVLAELVERQDLLAYLTLIGIEDPHDTILLHKERWKEQQN